MSSRTNISFKDLSKEQLILIINTQSAQISGLISQVENLSKRVEMFTKELERYKHPKNSSNSSILQSNDKNKPKRNQCLRQKSDRKVGGQKGHNGSTLKMVETPDEIIKLMLDYCNKCRDDLSDAEAILQSKCQLVAILPISPKYIEYQSFVSKYSCGHHQIGKYTLHITNHLQYRPSVEVAVGYYSVYQYLPFNRMKQMFAPVFNLPISESIVVNIVGKFDKKAQPVYEQIRSFIENSNTVGADETGIKVNSAKWWGWIWQSLLQFLYHKQVPPDNNVSERRVRNFKVKQKISCQFKMCKVAYTILRYVIDTSLEINVPVMQSMMLIAQMPVLATEYKYNS